MLGPRRIIIILLIISILHVLAVLLEAFLICRPLSAGWDQSATGSCGNQADSYLILEIVGLVIDLGLLIAPLYSISRIHMQLRQRFQLCGLFSVGSV